MCSRNIWYWPTCKLNCECVYIGWGIKRSLVFSGLCASTSVHKFRMHVWPTHNRILFSINHFLKWFEFYLFFFCTVKIGRHINRFLINCKLLTSSINCIIFEKNICSFNLSPDIVNLLQYKYFLESWVDNRNSFTFEVWVSHYRPVWTTFTLVMLAQLLILHYLKWILQFLVDLLHCRPTLAYFLMGTWLWDRPISRQSQWHTPA